MKQLSLLQVLTLYGAVGFASSLVKPTIKHPFLEKRQAGGFDWTTIDPSEKLVYHDCFDSFQCARLLVPLDWSKHNSTDGLGDDETAAIAILKIPATVPETDESFGGSVLYNPGGPGTSAVNAARTIYPLLQGGLIDGKKHFEIIAFDPRGVGASTPSIGCYRSNLARWADESREKTLASITSGPTPLNYFLQLTEAYWSVCNDAANSSSAFAYSSTASVARDMLQIIDKISEARPAKAKASAKCRPPQKTKKALLQYVGQSYGTFLGTTFASMFPDRVALMLLDGVLEPNDYVASDLSKGARNMDDVVDALWQKCFDTKAKCLLWKSSDSSYRDIRFRVNSFLNRLEASPIPSSVGGRAQLLTPDSIRQTIIGTATIGPTYPVVIDILNVLAAVMGGDYTAYFENINNVQPTVCLDQPTSGAAPFSEVDANNLLHCLDSYTAGRASEQSSASWAQGIIKTSNKVSSMLGAVIGQWSLQCYGFPENFKPSYVYQGPFKAPAPNKRQACSTIVAPILMVNNKLDPITPLSSAYETSRSFQNSVLVEQDTTGHMAIPQAGPCLKKIIQAYFNEGKMPKIGTVCQPQSA